MMVAFVIMVIEVCPLGPHYKIYNTRSNHYSLQQIYTIRLFGIVYSNDFRLIDCQTPYTRLDCSVSQFHVLMDYLDVTNWHRLFGHVDLAHQCKLVNGFSELFVLLFIVRRLTNCTHCSVSQFHLLPDYLDVTN